MSHAFDPGRRRAVAATGALILSSWGASALGALDPTPRQTRGPFYPEELPLDTDNDLVRVGGRDGMAAGKITDLRGRVLDPSGQPVDSATIEIWQCDANGRYIHRLDRRPGPRDPYFQGFGETTTDRDGRYRFRTIRPVPYPGRAPHIHVRVVPPGGGELVTQLYVAGHPRNRRDGILQSAAEPQRLIVPFEPVESPDATHRAHFDIVLSRRR